VTLPRVAFRAIRRRQDEQGDPEDEGRQVERGREVGGGDDRDHQGDAGKPVPASHDEPGRHDRGDGTDDRAGRDHDPRRRARADPARSLGEELLESDDGK
jgi:hypothetical protein